VISAHVTLTSHINITIKANVQPLDCSLYIVLLVLHLDISIGFREWDTGNRVLFKGAGVRWTLTKAGMTTEKYGLSGSLRIVANTFCIK
jgi:hypothetical protein